jgi:IS5 family transposase
LNELLDNANTCRCVWADSAYRSEAVEADLQANKTRFQARCRVLHVIAWMAQRAGKAVRGIGSS